MDGIITWQWKLLMFVIVICCAIVNTNLRIHSTNGCSTWRLTSYGEEVVFGSNFKKIPFNSQYRIAYLTNK